MATPYDYILGSPGIRFFDLRNMPTQNGVLKVGDIQTVLGHLLHRMRAHVVSPVSDLLSDPFDR